MPASQELEYFDGLKVNVEPLEEPSPVFFTDEKPFFKVTLRNTEDCKYEWGEGSNFRWTLELGQQQRPVYSDVVSFGPLEFGGKTTVEVGGKVLAYEGHGVLGIAANSASGKRDSDRYELNVGRESATEPAYSFSVWDESHYNASVRQPKKLQVAIILTSLVLIFFALIQIGFVVLS